MSNSIINFITAFVPVRSWRRKLRRRLRWWWYGIPVRRHAARVGADFMPEGHVRVDGKTDIGNDVVIKSLRKEGHGRLLIGNHVRLGRDFLVLTENHAYVNADRLPYGEGFETKDVTIGDCVWLGHRVTVLPGTTIGEGAIIQTGSVVHGNIPPLAIAGGNPARPFAARDAEHYWRVKKTMDGEGVRPIAKIAVLVPAYNVERYLGACLDSLLAQTHPVDVFCCDDGSTDGTRKILEAYAAKSPRIHALHHDNRGMSRTNNRLLDELPPEYDAFGFVDSDDYVHPKMYDRLLEALVRTDSEVAECRIQDVPNGSVYPEACRPLPPRIREKVVDDMSVFWLRRTSPGRWINKVNKLYRRSSTGKFRFREGLCHEDDFFYACEMNAEIGRKVLLAYPFYSYRRNPSSMTRHLNHRRYFDSTSCRIKLSVGVFLDASRVPEILQRKYRRELARDAYRMCIRKNLMNNVDAAERRELFLRAGEFFRKLERDSSFRPVGLNPVRRLVYRTCIGGNYLWARMLVALT